MLKLCKRITWEQKARRRKDGNAGKQELESRSGTLKTGH
jgi:hypothetical protein